MIRKIFYTIVALLVMASIAVMGLALARSHSALVQGIAPVAAASPAPLSTHAPPQPVATTPAPVTSSPAPSASSPLACTDPGTGCQSFVARPASLALAADGSVVITNLVWSSWGGVTATATGTLIT